MLVMQLSTTDFQKQSFDKWPCEVDLHSIRQAGVARALLNHHKGTILDSLKPVQTGLYSTNPMCTGRVLDLVKKGNGYIKGTFCFPVLRTVFKVVAIYDTDCFYAFSGEILDEA